MFSVRLLPAPAKAAPPPAPSLIGALKNIGSGLYQRTAKFAGYRAASPTATTGIGSRTGTNPNSTWANLQRVGMQFTAEDVSKNSAIAWAYLASRQNYCSSMMTYIPATGDSGLDAEIKSYLHGYDGCGGKFSTMGVDCSLQDAFMRTADIETPVRGDAGLIIHRDGSGELRLIEFSADQIGEIYQFTMPRACGLRMDSNGRLFEVGGDDVIYACGRYFRGCDCIAYKIYQRTNAWYGVPEIYQASDIIYFRDPASYRGVRGVTFFANAIQHMAKGEDLLQAALSAAQRQAKTFGRVFNEAGQSDQPSYETSTSGNITFFEKVPGGPVEEYFYNGDSAEFAAPNTPSAEVISGVETADERVAIALRLNYAFLISATKVGGAPSRLEVEKADKEFQRIQNTIHRPRLRRISDVTLMDALNKGEIVPPRGMTARQFLQGRWMLPISPSVDAFYDATENIKMARAGFEAPQDIIAETNRNPDDVIQKKGEWAEKCADEVDRRNASRVKRGMKPTITIADIAQISDNPQQAAAATNIDEGKPAAGGGDATAKLAEFDEGKHPRNSSGEFGSAEATRQATAHTKEKGKDASAEDHAKGAELHRKAAEAHHAEAMVSKGSVANYHGTTARAHEAVADWHEKQAAKEKVTA